jgi:hypothetical protein
MPMILLGIVITVAIGVGAFALLWKTQLDSGSSRSDARVSQPAIDDGSAANAPGSSDANGPPPRAGEALQTGSAAPNVGAP